MWADATRGAQGINPDTGALVALGQVPSTLGMRAWSLQGLALDSGKLYGLGAYTVSLDDGNAEVCRSLAARLGQADYAAAPYVGKYVSAGLGDAGALSLASKLASGPEILLYGSSAANDATASTLTVASTNPDAFVCILTEGEKLAIQIPDTARFRLAYVFSEQPSITFDIKSGFVRPRRPSVYVKISSSDPASFDPSLTAHPDVVRILSAHEWTDRRLQASFNLTASTYGPAVLAELSRTTGAVVKFVELADPNVRWALSPWAP